MINLLKKLYLSNEGATAVEYGLVLVLVALAALVAITDVADTTINIWNDVATQVTEAS